MCNKAWHNLATRAMGALCSGSSIRLLYTFTNSLPMEDSDFNTSPNFGFIQKFDNIFVSEPADPTLFKGKISAKPKEPPPATNPTISQDKTAGTEEAQAELLAFLAQKLRLLVVCSMLLSFLIPL